MARSAGVELLWHPPYWDRRQAIPCSEQSLLCQAESIKKAWHAVPALFSMFVFPTLTSLPSSVFS
jgi:hypothetical protein